MNNTDNKQNQERLQWVKPELIESVISNTEGKDTTFSTEDNIHVGPS